MPNLHPHSTLETPANPGLLKWRAWKVAEVSLVAFVVGLGLTVGTVVWKKEQLVAEAEVRFKFHEQAVKEFVAARAKFAIYGLNGARGLFAASQTVDRSEFRAYVESRDMAREFVGVRGFSYIERVLRPNVDAFVAAEQADGSPQFAVRQLEDKSHEDLYIVKFMEPAATNPGVQGLDIGSEAIRRAAAQSAVDAGEPHISSAITLVQDQHRTPGVLLFVPVYANGAQPKTVSERRAALKGLLSAPLVMSELLTGMPSARDGLVDFELFDDKGALLFDSDWHSSGSDARPNSSVADRRFSTVQKFTLAGSDLTLRVNSTSAFDSKVTGDTLTTIFALGCLLSVVLSLLLRQRLIGQQLAETRALEMTKDLRAEIEVRKQVESELREAEEGAQALMNELTLQKYALDEHAIVATTNVQGRITYVNDKFCAISGYTRSELLGQDHSVLNSGKHPHGFFKAMYRTVAVGKTWRDEICNKAKNGELYWVDTTIVPVMGSDGKPEQYLAIRSDITMRKQVELDLIQHQLQLEKRVQQKTQAAVQSERHLRLIIDNSLDSVVGMDGEGRITDWNRQAELTFGWTLAEAKGQPLHTFIIPEQYREVYQHGMEHYKRFEILALRRDGTIFPTELAVVPIVTPVGTTFSAFITDVTQRKRQQADLEAAKALAESANRSKSEFLANMSHEIRTPMNGVVGMVDILQETALSPEQHRMLETIQQSSLALLDILNDILDFSKIEAGKLEVERTPTHLREVAEGSVQLMLFLSNARSVDLSVFVSPALPLWVMGDPTRLRQVLLNLVGNAVKFSRLGHRPRVDVHVEPCALSGGEAGVRIRVTDQGIGMSADVIASLFQPFMQADESTARKYGGTGLGLSITRRLVELMGGTISVTSALGEGSVFTVDLPLQSCEPGRKVPILPSLEGVWVIAVAADPFALQAVPAYAQAAGATVTTVADVAAARTLLLQAPERWPSAVVLVDAGNTNPTRALDLPPGVGVVRAIQRGSDRFESEVTLATYPVLYADLIHAIASAHAHKVRTDGAVDRRTRPRPAAQTVDEALQARRLILLAEDNPTNRNVMQQQLRLLGYACEVAEDGAIALQMWDTNPGRYALLLCDCHMPNLDGFGLTAAIRAQEDHNTRLPIIAVTANAMQGEAQRCYERGMDGYLSKPLRMQELSAMLGKWMPNAEPASKPEATPLDVVQATTSHGARAEDSLPVWNENTLRELVGDDPDMLADLLHEFLRNAEVQTKAIAAAASLGDTDAMAGDAHTLKSAARSVGALALGDLCQRLETTGRAGDAQACIAMVQGLPAAFTMAATAICSHLAE